MYSTLAGVSLYLVPCSSLDPTLDNLSLNLNRVQTYRAQSFPRGDSFCLLVVLWTEDAVLGPDNRPTDRTEK